MRFSKVFFIGNVEGSRFFNVPWLGVDPLFGLLFSGPLCFMLHEFEAQDFHDFTCTSKRTEICG